MADVLKLSSSDSLEKILQAAVEVILRGGALAYPTETFYGLGVDAQSDAAIRNIFNIKGRDFKNPVSVIIGNLDQLTPLVRTITPAAQKLIETFWPGPLTIVFAASENVSPVLTAGTGKIGVRLSSLKFARRLALAAQRPITATSANLSGAPECPDADAVLKQIGDKIDAVIDLGEKGGNVGSTILDASGENPVILRSGLVTSEAIASQTGLLVKQAGIYGKK